MRKTVLKIIKMKQNRQRRDEEIQLGYNLTTIQMLLKQRKEMKQAKSHQLMMLQQTVIMKSRVGMRARLEDKHQGNDNNIYYLHLR